MAEHAKRQPRGPLIPQVRTVGTVAATARQQLAGVWSRESVLRLLLSLVLALALWLYVTGKQNPSTPQLYPYALAVSTTGLPSDLTVTNTLPPVHVRIHSAPNTPVTTASFQTYVDLTGVGAGLHILPVKVVADPGIFVAGVTPSTVRVNVAPIITKHIPVRWHIFSKPPAGYTAGPVRVQPTTVNISGPKSVVSEVAQAGIYLDLSQARSSVVSPYKPSPENSQGVPVKGQLTLDPSEVQVDIPIKAVSSYKTLPLLVSLKGLPKKGYDVSSVTANPADVAATGAPSTLSSLANLSTSTVNVSGKGPGKYTTRVKVVLPKAVSSSTRWVTVTVQVAPVDVSASIELGVSPTSVQPGLQATVQPSKVLVTVVGPTSQVSQAAKSVRATINLSGNGIGTFQLRPALHVPHGMQVQSVSPSTVTVIIRSASGG